MREQESSNYREFSNLVEMIEKLVQDGTLAGNELFMFTNNSTAESSLPFSRACRRARNCFNLCSSASASCREILELSLCSGNAPK
jgi:hypothetical protein